MTHLILPLTGVTRTAPTPTHSTPKPPDHQTTRPPNPQTPRPLDRQIAPPPTPQTHLHRDLPLARTMATAYKQFLPPRDFVGYGLDTPKGDIWPNGAKIAVSFVLNCEWCGGGSSVPTFSCYHHFFLLCPFPPGSDSLRIAV